MKHLLLLTGTLFLFQSICYSQEGKNLKREALHNEKEHDPYLPNKWNNQKTSPAVRYSVMPKRTAGGSSIFTTQVNVNSSGQNIIGDAANEPSIAVSPVNKNRIVMGWRQFDNISSSFRQAGWAYSSDTGATWTFPGVIQPGIFRSDPVLDVDTAGNFYYNSLTNTPTFLCKVFKSTNGGVNWSTAVDAAGGDKQWMAIDRTGGAGTNNIYSSWSSFNSSCAPGFFVRSANAGISFESCIWVDGDPYFGTMAVGNAGEICLAGESNTLNSFVFVKSLNAQTAGSVIAWEPAVPVFIDGYLTGSTGVNPAGLLGQVNVDIDRSGGPGHDNIYILASVARISTFDPCDVMFTRSTDGGSTWSSPIKVNDDLSSVNTQWFGTMSVAPNGRIDAVWLDTRDASLGSDSSALYYSYSLDQGITWSQNEKLSVDFDPHVGYPNQNKLGDYFDMVSDNTGAHLAWANTINEEQDVYYSYIMPQIFTPVHETTVQSANVFPNPSDGIIYISGASENPEARLFSMQGQLILKQKQAEMLDLSKVSSGVYLLELQYSDGRMENRKILRN
jgi:hypothetical protein